jgi:hypothetical protein
VGEHIKKTLFMSSHRLLLEPVLTTSIAMMSSTQLLLD